MNGPVGSWTMDDALSIRGSRSASRILAVAAVLVLAACGGGGSTTGTVNPGSNNTGGTGGSSGSGDVLITIQNFAYKTTNGTDSITVAVGSTVTWRNEDGAQHTATSDSVPAGASAFDTGLLNQGQASQAYTLSKAGRYVYHCEVHPTTMAHAVIIAQ